MIFANWIANGIATSSAIQPKGRRILLRFLGAQVGHSRILFGGTYYGDLAKLSIGDGVFINADVALFVSGGITIGDNVAIGPRSLIMTGTHAIGSSEKRASSPTVFSPVTIEAGAWLGAGVVVQSGVTIGHGTIVKAGSVVTRDCEPDSIYAGTPAVKTGDAVSPVS